MFHVPAQHQTDPRKAASSFDPSSICGIAAPKIGDQYPSAGDGFMSPVAFVGSGGTILTDCDFHRAAQRMERGGGFEQKLAALYYVADGHNQRKLRDAFIDHFVGRHNDNVRDAVRRAASNDGSSSRRAEDGYCGS